NSKHHDIQAQMKRYGGLDHPFQIGDRVMRGDNKHFQLSVETDMTDVVIFAFNDTTEWESDCIIYKSYSVFTLQMQFIPDDINLYGENAPSIIEANQPFYSKTSYKIAEKTSGEAE